MSRPDASMARRGLHPFARPGLWLGIWGFGWVLCVVLSLMRDPPMPSGVPGADKVLHALAYALLSGWAALLFASRRARWLAALSLVALGVAMELAQGEWTTYRSMDAWDGLADAVGVLLGQAMAWRATRAWLVRLDRHLFSNGRGTAPRG